MQGANDNESYGLHTRAYDIAFFTDIGDRDEQQDSYGWLAGEESAFIVICDGMGGYQGGRTASRLAVQTVLTAYERQTDGGAPVSFLQDATRRADRAVSRYVPRDGTRFDGGTTLISLLLFKSYLFWNSVGDSRIYLFRGKKEYAQLTQDQNYRTVIDEQLRTGKITEREYRQEERKANALINYIGIGDIELIDYNHTPFLLQKDDVILMTTDGLYRQMSDQQIADIIMRGNAAEETVQALAAEAMQNAKKRVRSQDNLTMALIHVK